MTTLVAAQEAVYARFAALWTGTPMSRVVLDNESNAAVDAQDLAWIRVSVQEIGGGQETLGPPGSRKYRRGARASVQVFVPIDKGKTQAVTLAEQARTIFEGTSFSDLDFTNARITDTGRSEKWHTTLVTAAFDFDETK